MKKNWLQVLLIIVLCLSFVGCDKEKEAEDNNTTKVPEQVTTIKGDRFETDDFSMIIADGFSKFEIDGGVQAYKSNDVIEIWLRGFNNTENDAKSGAENLSKTHKGTEVKKSIIAGAHSVSALGSTMAIKKRLLTDKEFEPYIKKIKKGQIIKFKKWIVKKGEKKTYEIMYEATLNGQPKYVYSRMFQIDGKDYACHTNAKTLAAAKTLQAICNSVSK